MSATKPIPPSPVETLYGDHHGWLTSWLKRRLGNAFDAADLAQDTFVRVLGKAGDLPQVREPRAWLTTIAHGLVVDHVRRAQLERAYVEAIAHLPQAMAPSPEDRLLILQALHAIDTLLDGLNPKARQAFLMSRLDHMGYAAIALELGVSLSSVEKYMAQAIRHCLDMRRQLGSLAT